MRGRAFIDVPFVAASVVGTTPSIRYPEGVFDPRQSSLGLMFKFLRFLVIANTSIRRFRTGRRSRRQSLLRIQSSLQRSDPASYRQQLRSPGLPRVSVRPIPPMEICETVSTLRPDLRSAKVPDAR